MESSDADSSVEESDLSQMDIDDAPDASQELCQVWNRIKPTLASILALQPAWQGETIIAQTDQVAESMRIALRTSPDPSDAISCFKTQLSGLASFAAATMDNCREQRAKFDASLLAGREAKLRQAFERVHNLAADIYSQLVQVLPPDLQPPIQVPTVAECAPVAGEDALQARGPEILSKMEGALGRVTKELPELGAVQVLAREARLAIVAAMSPGSEETPVEAAVASALGALHHLFLALDTLTGTIPGQLEEAAKSVTPYDARGAQSWLLLARNVVDVFSGASTLAQWAPHGNYPGLSSRLIPEWVSRIAAAKSIDVGTCWVTIEQLHSCVPVVDWLRRQPGARVEIESGWAALLEQVAAHVNGLAGHRPFEANPADLLAPLDRFVRAFGQVMAQAPVAVSGSGPGCDPSALESLRSALDLLRTYCSDKSGVPTETVGALLEQIKSAINRGPGVIERGIATSKAQIEQSADRP